MPMTGTHGITVLQILAWQHLYEAAYAWCQALRLMKPKTHAGQTLLLDPMQAKTNCLNPCWLNLIAKPEAALIAQTHAG